jgi:hypothetical protein
VTSSVCGTDSVKVVELVEARYAVELAEDEPWLPFATAVSLIRAGPNADQRLPPKA